MEKFEIRITVDTNDADYNTEINTISVKDLNKIKPLIKAIAKFKPYTVETKGMSETHHYNYNINWREDLGEKSPKELYDFPEEVHELFQEYCPSAGEDGFHTIESITVHPKVKKEKLL